MYSGLFQPKAFDTELYVNNIDNPINDINTINIKENSNTNNIPLNINSGNPALDTKQLRTVSAGAWGGNGVGAYDGNKYKSLAEALNANAVVNISQWSSVPASGKMN